MALFHLYIYSLPQFLIHKLDNLFEPVKVVITTRTIRQSLRVRLLLIILTFLLPKFAL